MAVYLDDTVHPWRGERWGHLLADTLGELHAAAERLGIPRRAFQNHASGAHYDVPARLRELALAQGVIAVSRHTDRALLRRLIANARAQSRDGGSLSRPHRLRETERSAATGRLAILADLEGAGPRAMTRNDPMSDTPPEHLSVDPRSRFHDATALARGVGVRFNGIERNDVEEYSVGEGWIRVQVGRARDRRGNPMTMKIAGKVEPYYLDIAAQAG